MKCPNCGQKLAKDQTVCSHCGSPVTKRKNRTLASVLFVILFVLIVSAALIFLNLKSRGDLPELSLNNIRSIFVREKAAPAAETSEPAATEEPEPTGEPEPSTEPEPTDAPEPSAEPEPTEVPEPSAEPEPTEVPVLAAADAPDANDVTVLDTVTEGSESLPLEPLEAYRSAEKQSLSLLTKVWAACRGADPEAPDKLLQGDGELLLRLCLSAWLDGRAGSDFVLNTAGELETWSLFGDKAAEADANAPFRALLASEDFDTLLDSYWELVLANIDDVAQSSEALEAEGIVARYPNCYTVDLDAAALQRIASSVIGTLRWDKSIAGILGEEELAAFLARLDELDYKLDTGAIAPDAALHMVVYANEDGQLCGRTLTLENANRSGRFVFALATDGEDTGLELSLRDADGLRAVTGRGSNTDSGIEGSYRFLKDGKSLGSAAVEAAA